MGRVCGSTILIALLAACGARGGLRVGDDAGRADAGVPSADATAGDAGAPPTGCGGYPAAPTPIVVDRSFSSIRAIAIEGDQLFFGAQDDFDPAVTPTGGLYRLPAGGGPVEELALETPYVSGGFLVLGRRVMYHEVVPVRTGPTSWSFTYPRVVVHHLEDGLETRLDTALEPDAARATPFAVTSDGRLYYVTQRVRGADGVRMYDTRTGDDISVRTGVDARRMLAVEDDVLLWSRTEDGEGVLEVFDGIEFREVHREADFACCWPLTADSDAVYVHRRRTAIEHWGIRTGVVRRMVETAHGNIHAAPDSRNLYYSESADIRYVRLTGAEPPRTLSSRGTEYVETMRTDDCGLWWAAVNPPSVLLHAALP